MIVGAPLQFYGVVLPAPLSRGVFAAFGVSGGSSGTLPPPGPSNAYLLVRGQPVTVRGNEMLIRGQGAPASFLQVRGQDVTVRGQDINFGTTPSSGTNLFGQNATVFSQPITIFGA